VNPTLVAPFDDRPDWLLDPSGQDATQFVVQRLPFGTRILDSNLLRKLVVVAMLIAA
jgi:hypothetical protein